MAVQQVILGSASARWATYLKERFPLPMYVLMTAGFARSGSLVGGESALGAPLAYAFLGVLGFFALLRLMDERKDYEKDLTAHPERPLPRGLLTTTEAERAVNTAAVAMLAYACGGIAFVNAVAGVNYLVLTGYLWLMYREFYVGHWLEERPLLYAATHQLVLVLLCTFCVFCVNPALVGSPEPYLFGALVLGSFFSYEVCRKLDPHAATVLRYYRHLYGAGGCLILVGVATALAAWAAGRLGVGLVAWPAEALLLLSFVLFVTKKPKVVEGVAALSLAVHLWAISLAGVLK